MDEEKEGPKSQQHATHRSQVQSPVCTWGCGGDHCTSREGGGGGGGKTEMMAKVAWPGDPISPRFNPLPVLASDVINR